MPPCLPLEQGQEDWTPACRSRGELMQLSPFSVGEEAPGALPGKPFPSPLQGRPLR